MITPDHAIKSFQTINAKNPKYLKDNWEVLYPLLWELHYWFDKFSGDKGYDTPYSNWYHKEVRHHDSGITQAVDHFCYKYGLEFENIIRQEAERHVRDDFGEIPSKSQCTRSYLRHIRGC